MKHIVSYSGGICSFWAAHRVIAQHGPGDVTLLFADTKMEDEDLYRFNADAEKILGVAITTIADGRTPWEVFRDERFIGNSRVDPCSKILKRELLWKWIMENCIPADTTVYLGLDWTEEHRLDSVRKRNPGWAILAPMIEGEPWTKTRMLDELRQLGIAAPRLYALGFAHNNCGGFCIKSGQAQFALLLRTMPERYKFHEENEERIRNHLAKNISILRYKKNGRTIPITLREFRKRIQSQCEFEFDGDDWGGCGCGV